MADSQRLFPWLERGDRLILAGLSVLLIAMLGVYHARMTGLFADRARFDDGLVIPSHQVNINTAEWWELQAIYGVGEVRAREIIADRIQRGPYRTVDELTRVRGIGPKSIERLRPHLTTGSGNGQ